MTDKIAINVEQVTKKYVMQNYAGNIGNSETIALNNVSFKVMHGECVGIIGNNGSGKSTLIKVIAGITKPTEGKVSLYGKVASIVDIAAGFHPDLSGLENIFLNAQLLGIKKSEVNLALNKIIDFSEIGSFINQPVKYYSNGMYLRLAFSIMVNLNFDIYLLDEVLSVGDEGFREKCQNKIFDLVQQKNKTFLVVTHHIQELQNIASKYLYLNNGNVNAINSMDNYFEDKYFKNNSHLKVNNTIEANEIFEKIECAFLEKETFNFNFEEVAIARIKFINLKRNINIGISVKDQFKNAVFETYFNKLILAGNICSLEITLPASFFNQGIYTIDLIIFEKENILLFIKKVLQFLVNPYMHHNCIEKRSWGPANPKIQLKVV